MKERPIKRAGLPVRWVLVATGILVMLCVGVAILVGIGSVRDQLSSSHTATEPILEAEPASDTLAAEVQGTVTIMDSLLQYRSASTYTVHVMIEEDVTYMPTGIKLFDSTSQTLLATAPLSAQPELKCWRGISLQSINQPVFQTEPLTDPALLTFAHRPSQPVTLYVRSDDGQFRVDGLEITERCREEIE